MLRKLIDWTGVGVKFNGNINEIIESYEEPVRMRLIGHRRTFKFYGIHVFWIGFGVIVGEKTLARSPAKEHGEPERKRGM